MAETNVITRISPELEGGWRCNCDSIEMIQENISTDDVGQWVERMYGINTSQLARDLPSTEHTCQCIPSNLRADSSVNILGYPGLKVGEISPSDHEILTIDTWREWLRKNYPTHVNMSCGMHVHVSIPQGIYQTFMTPEWEKFLLKELVRWGQAFKIPLWHPFWYRVTGNNTYTRIGITHEIIAEQVAAKRATNRYYATNFSWTRHQSLETRILPMFKQARTAEHAINAVLRAINRFAELRKPYRAMKFKPETIMTSAITPVHDITRIHTGQPGMKLRRGFIAEDGIFYPCCEDDPNDDGQYTFPQIERRVRSYDCSTWLKPKRRRRS